MRAFRPILAFAIAVFLGLSAQAPVLDQALAANWLEKSIYMTGLNFDGQLPPCEAALGKIASRFGEKEGMYWNSDLRIVDFEDVREIAFRPWAAGTIPRRFCAALATVSDGKKRPVNYSIGEDTGMIGMTWGVEWCVVGLDRNWAYNPRCKMARP
ncbi:MAG TPA: hypothetical protein VGC38_09540 [Pseudolabrys sp.]